MAETPRTKIHAFIGETSISITSGYAAAQVTMYALPDDTPVQIGRRGTELPDWPKTTVGEILQWLEDRAKKAQADKEQAAALKLPGRDEPAPGLAVHVLEEAAANSRRALMAEDSVRFPLERARELANGATPTPADGSAVTLGEVLAEQRAEMDRTSPAPVIEVPAAAPVGLVHDPNKCAVCGGTHFGTGAWQQCPTPPPPAVSSPVTPGSDAVLGDGIRDPQIPF